MPGTEMMMFKKKKTSASSVSQRKSADGQGSGFVDRRPLPISQKKERTREEEKADVEAAKEYTEALIKKSETTAEVEKEFPDIKENWDLTEIGWENLGTPQAKIIVEINPKAQITNNLGTLKLGGGTAFVGDIDSDVTFHTKKYGGSDVGIKMEAAPIAPNHPQGGPPTGASLRNIMSLLPTNPKQQGTLKYIKGHLLNDNLGGPGEDQNLFPITAQANKQHESDVESYVKDWVNEKGYAVNYTVEVTNVNDQLGVSPPYIDADFECTAYARNSFGSISTQRLKRTIPSRYKQNAATVDVGLAGTAAKPHQESGWAGKKSQVELSTSQGSPTQPATIDDGVRDAATDLLDALVVRGLDDAYCTIVMGGLFPGYTLIQRKMLLNDRFTYNYSVTHQDFAGYANSTGQWNTNMNPINKNSGDVIQALDELKKRVLAHILLDPDLATGKTLTRREKGKMAQDINRLSNGTYGHGLGDITIK